MMSVLFVCTGNTCRSPMAAALLARLRPDLDVASAGVDARPGDPAEGDAILTMAARDLDLRAHRTRRMTPELGHDHDLVLCMTQSHVACVRALAPGANVRTLSMRAGQDGDICDPIGKGRQAYEACAEQLDDLIAAVELP